MESIAEVLRLLKRQAEIQQSLRPNSSTGVLEEREFFLIRNRLARLVNITASGMGSSRLRYPAGASMHNTLQPAVIPSFFASGVPE